VCSAGAWGCPSGSVDSRTCNGCVGLRPPNHVCGDAGWVSVDASDGN
jgi:hypothetical protein